MPYLMKSNPILMCVNKDLLDKEGIAVPKEGWTLEEFYTICKKLTKGYQWGWAIGPIWKYRIHLERSLSGKWRSSLPGWHAQADSSRSQRVSDFSAKLEDLNKNYKVSSKDFDQGKSRLLSHDLGPISDL